VRVTTRNMLMHPATGMPIDPHDPDALISAFEEVDREYRALTATRKRLACLIAGLTDGEKKVRRIRGKARAAKVTMADDSWEQSILKEAWNSYPKLRAEMLAIERIRVRMREWKKALGTKGRKDFEQLRDMIKSAKGAGHGTPRIEVEK